MNFQRLPAERQAMPDQAAKRGKAELGVLVPVAYATVVDLIFERRGLALAFQDKARILLNPAVIAR